jgi:sugar phosphate isomerase/epimerase
MMSSHLTRRTFLLAASAAVAAASQPFRVGIVPAGPSFWPNVDAVSQLGFHSIEFNNTRSRVVEEWSSRATEFKDELAKRQLTLAGVAQFSHIADPLLHDELLEGHMLLGRFLAAVGGSYITNMIAPGTVLNEPADEAEYRSVNPTVWARHANEIGRRLQEEFGVSLAYHPEQGEIRTGLCERILEETDQRWLRLLVDTGHIASGDTDPARFCARWAKRLVCVHLKDFHPGTKPRKPGNAPFGEGTVDLRAVIDVLRNTSFDGWIMAESGGTNQHMRDYLTAQCGLSL